MLFTVVTLFPEMFPWPLGQSLLGRNTGKLWDLRTVNIRDFSQNKHNKVDDTPYGGGAGMVMRPDVVHRAMLHALSFYNNHPKVIFMTPRGKIFNDATARSIASHNKDGAIILCGRYEGIDQRVIDLWVKEYGMEEISVGDYILFGGEIPAMIVIEACARFIDGMLGNPDSSEDESFSSGLLEHSHYTKPANWNNLDVPQILMSGNHEAIRKWRYEESLAITKSRRIDLYEQFLKQSKK